MFVQLFNSLKISFKLITMPTKKFIGENVKIFQVPNSMMVMMTTSVTTLSIPVKKSLDVTSLSKLSAKEVSVQLLDAKIQKERKLSLQRLLEVAVVSAIRQN